MNQITEKIRLWGIVQGVGFRPFVAKLADRMNMRGTVLNIGGLVDITLTDSPERIDAFIEALKSEKPEPAEIVHIKRSPAELTGFDDFRIIQSASGSDEAAMIPPDMAICDHCLKELYDPEDPRYQHPFISCMICGPRYTIIDRIPYDRENTSMVDFPMCDFCEGQYNDLDDRRHHAQTISCHDCGPYLKWVGRDDESARWVGRDDEFARWVGRDDEPASNDALILDKAAQIINNGGVIAFKCVGGYNLIASPFSEDAVRKLREIKKRPTKPFAVMFRSIEQIRQYCDVDDVEEKLLSSSARPIILLEHKLGETTSTDDLIDMVGEMSGEYSDASESKHLPLSLKELKRSRFIGSFLPSLAAQYLLLDRTGPVISTSANRSDLPMIIDDDEMKEWFDAEPLIDGIVYNDRKIRIRMDDSVCRVIDDQPQMIRRSKGYAPLPLYIDTSDESNDDEAKAVTGSVEHRDTVDPGRSNRSVFATGGQLKNSFALTKGPFVYMSQYFGDLDTVENQNIFRENIARMSDLFRIKPDVIACDMHPLYETTKMAEEYAKAMELPLLKVQHHHAHVASVMAENDLDGPVIGVSFDGTGYGTDGRIWGGEFLLCEGAGFERMSHLRYIPMIGGDSSMKDARRSALSYMLDRGAEGRTSCNEDCTSCNEGRLSTDQDTAPTDQDRAPAESDCRQLDIDLSDIIEFGAERLMGCPDAAMITKAIGSGINTIESSSMGRLFDAVSALLGICDYNEYEGKCAIMLEDAAAYAAGHPGEDKASDLALAFHERVIALIVSECMRIRDEKGADQVALTGGTFQNRILMEGCLAELRRRDFKPYYNISVSPNDGGIALGQAYVAMKKSGHAL